MCWTTAAVRYLTSKDIRQSKLKLSTGYASVLTRFMLRHRAFQLQLGLSEAKAQC